MDEFPSNSYRPKKTEPVEKKEIKRVVAGDVIRRKKPLGSRLFETFIGGDAKTTFEYVMASVVIPSVKDTIADMVSQGIEKMMFGEVRSSSRRSGIRPTGNSGFVSYNRYAPGSNSRPDPRAPIPRKPLTSIQSFDEVVVPLRAEAEEVLDGLFLLMNEYNQASVSDLYGLLGLTANYTDNKWGWTSIEGAEIRRVRDGYLLDLPRPEPFE